MTPLIRYPDDDPIDDDAPDVSAEVRAFKARVDSGELGLSDGLQGFLTDVLVDLLIDIRNADAATWQDFEAYVDGQLAHIGKEDDCA